MRAHFVQPYETAEHILDFVPVISGTDVHSFEWRADRVTCRSGGREWTYRGSEVPPPGGEHVRISLWLHRGTPPTDQADTHLLITSFRYEP